MAAATTTFLVKPEDGWTLIATNPAGLLMKTAESGSWRLAVTAAGLPASTTLGLLFGRGQDDNKNIVEFGAITGLVYVKAQMCPMHFEVITGVNVSGGPSAAVTIADGADVAEGTTTDAAYADATGAAAGTVISLLKGMYVALKGFLQVTVSPIRTDATSHSGTMTLGGTAQDLMAANASRNGWSFQNQSGEYMYLRSKGSGGGTVATQDQNSIRVAPGQVYESPYVSPYAISVISATTGSAFWSREW